MSRRLYKINELLSQELAKLVQEEFAEKYGIITINLLDTSHNLDKARAYISILDTKSKNKDKILGILNNHSSSFQKYLVKKLHLKKIPQFEFVLDESIDKINKIEGILDQIGKEDRK